MACKVSYYPSLYIQTINCSTIFILFLLNLNVYIYMLGVLLSSSLPEFMSIILLDINWGRLLGICHKFDDNLTKHLK